MVKIGGFLKTRQFARRQRAVGRFRSPYQKGGSLVGTSIVPFFPTRAKPWEVPIMRRIKASNRRPKRKRR